MKKLMTIIVLLFWVCISYSQERTERIRQQLDSLAAYYPGLNNTVEMSVDGFTVQDLIRGIAKMNDLNVSVDSDINQLVVNNFANAKVKDVFVFLCKKYNLQLDVIGSIISFKNYVPPPKEPEPYQPKEVDIEYKDRTDFISLDLRNDSIDYVAREITMSSPYNVVLAPEVKGKRVSVFIKNRPFEDAIEKMCYSNDLVFEKTSNNFYLIDLPDSNADLERKNGKGKNGQPDGEALLSSLPKDVELTIGKGGLISLSASNVDVAKIIKAVSFKLNRSYFMYDEPKGNSSFMIVDASYEEFLRYVLHGSEYTFKEQEGLILIGNRNLEGLRSTELIRMENRTIETVVPSIPAGLKEGITIHEFTDLNGIVVSGSILRIHELKTFLKEIDKVVPMINIEIVIMDVQNTDMIETGVSFGTDGDAETGGNWDGGLNAEFDAGTLNGLISAFNGFGLINLGFVPADFYLKIKALESAGKVKVNSTPKLATLNGHEADMSIGATEYYAETQTNTIGSDNPTTVTSRNYKSTKADLKVTITPVVSNDEQVTLEIQVQQADFTARIAEDAPPGQVNRTFNSTIRIKNREMVLLGGLEKESKSSTTSGVPLISKIPVLKWFFSNRTKEKSKSKLVIFIRPTVIY